MSMRARGIENQNKESHHKHTSIHSHIHTRSGTHRQITKSTHRTRAKTQTHTHKEKPHSSHRWCGKLESSSLSVLSYKTYGHKQIHAPKRPTLKSASLLLILFLCLAITRLVGRLGIRRVCLCSKSIYIHVVHIIIIIFFYSVIAVHFIYVYIKKRRKTFLLCDIQN